MMFFHSVEFYIILLVAAAALVGLIAVPRRNAPVTEHLIPSLLIPDEPSHYPTITIDCDTDGIPRLTRSGLQGISLNGAVSAKVIVNGSSITIFERSIPGHHSPKSPYPTPSSTTTTLSANPTSDSPPNDQPCDIAACAIFTLDFLPAGRYYLRYESETTSTHATLTFRVTPDFKTTPAPLKP